MPMAASRYSARSSRKLSVCFTTSSGEGSEVNILIMNMKRKSKWKSELLRKEKKKKYLKKNG